MNRENAVETMSHGKPESMRRAWRNALAISLCLFGVFVLVVYAYARIGGPWVDALDDRNGEIVALRATSAATADRTDQSIDLFEKAIGLGFQTPDQYVWVRQRYVAVLLEAERYERAEPIAAEMLASDVPEIGDWVGRMAFSRIHSAISAKGLHESAVRAAQQWHDVGLRCGNRTAQGQGLLLKGVSLRKLGKNDEARLAFEAAYQANPTPEMKAAIDRESG